MVIRVLYHTQTGNTEKVAIAIAEAMGVQAEAITEGTTVGMTDLLFIGDGMYGGKPAAVSQRLLAGVAGCNVRLAAVLETSRRQRPC
jgi:hypothetical protein